MLLLKVVVVFYFFLSHWKVCGILVSQPGIKPRHPAWKRGVLTTGPPGKSHVPCFVFGLALQFVGFSNQGLNLGPLVLRAQSPNHWITREFSVVFIFTKIYKNLTLTNTISLESSF